jgi:two-component system KDP operon response regulator KdpE
MRRFLRTYLSGAGYNVSEAGTGEKAIGIAGKRRPDLVLLDLGLPDMDGQDVLKILREWLVAPIIVLSIRSEEMQKITALDNGADDYLTKPFDTGELLARIRLAFRHSLRRESRSDATIFDYDGLRVDFAVRQVSLDDNEVHLTPMEYKLLAALIRHHGRVLTHQFLLDDVWGPQKETEPQVLRVLMAGLRRKIEIDPANPAYIITEQGVGYRLAARRRTTN